MNRYSAMSTITFPLENRNIYSGLQMLSALVTKRMVPGPTWNRPSYRLKFLLRTLASPKATLTLLDYLANHPLRDDMLRAVPSLPCKLHRVYQSVNVSRAIALNNIIAHYDYLAMRVPPALTRGHFEDKPLHIATLEGKDGQRYFIQFNAAGRLDKEGEATLMFTTESGEPLATVTFSFINYRGQPTLFVGAIQGPRAHIEHSQIQIATKACHGLFPKKLVMEALLLVAELTQMTHIVAVANNTHIYENSRYKKRKGMMFADYNSFWETLNGTLGEDGYYHLPGQIPHRPLEEIASKRRSEYRRRYELLDLLEVQIRRTFSQGFAANNKADAA